MKCTTTREQLLEPVVRTEKMTGKNHTLPVLACVLLEVRGDILSCTATNLDVGAEYSIPVNEAEAGKVAVSGSVLSHVISTLPNASKITLESSDGHLSVKSSSGVSKIALQDAEEFPMLPRVENGTEITLPAKVLGEAITSVSYCASNSTIKPELSSVFIHADGGVLVATATDSFRLAEKRVPLKQPVTADPFLLPAKSAVDLLKVLELSDDMVTLHINEHQLAIALADVYMTLRLVSGTFPDYTQIIPKEYVTEATVLVFDFERALRKSAVFSDQFNQTTLTVAPKKKTFIIHSEYASVGETTDDVSAALTGEELTISFNQRYLIESLHTIASDSVTVQFAGQSQPAVVRPVGDASFLYLVMPMNR